MPRPVQLGFILFFEHYYKTWKSLLLALQTYNSPNAVASSVHPGQARESHSLFAPFNFHWVHKFSQSVPLASHTCLLN